MKVKGMIFPGNVYLSQIDKFLSSEGFFSVFPNTIFRFVSHKSKNGILTRMKRHVLTIRSFRFVSTEAVQRCISSFH